MPTDSSPTARPIAGGFLANRGKQTTDASRPWESYVCRAVSCAALADPHWGVLEAHLYVAFVLADLAIGLKGQVWEPEWAAAKQAASIWDRSV
jgi:hypothetical protein